MIPAHDALLFNLRQMRVRGWFLLWDFVHTVAGGATGELAARGGAVIEELNQAWPEMIEHMRNIDAVLRHVGATPPAPPQSPSEAMNWSADVGEKLDVAIGAPQRTFEWYCGWLGQAIGMARATLNMAILVYRLLPADPQNAELLRRAESVAQMRADHDQWFARALERQDVPDGFADTVQYMRDAFNEPWQLDPRSEPESLAGACEWAVKRLDAAVSVMSEQLK